MFKSLFSKNISYNDIKSIFHKKSDYLKNLEKRKNKSIRIINKTKNELLKQKILKSHLIQRNYKIFSKNEIFIPNNSSSKFYFAPNIKPIFLSKEESEYYEIYKKKDFDIDNFSLIYKTTNSKEFPIRIVNKIKYKNENEKFNKSNYSKNNKSFADSFMISVANSVMSNNSRYNQSNF